MATLNELMAKRSQESRQRIEERVEELRQDVALSQIREALDLSQTQLAEALGVSQPTVARIEKPENDPRLSTLKRYVAALGGKLSLDVELPDGKRIGVSI